MKRRSFLKTLAMGIAALFTPVKIFYPKPSLQVPPMAAYVRRQLDYQAIGRKLLMVDELPQGAYARYAKDVRNFVSG